MANIQNYSLGKINCGLIDLNIQDIFEYSDKKDWCGKTLTAIKLFFSGKGVITSSGIKKLLKENQARLIGLDPNPKILTLFKTYTINVEILKEIPVKKQEIVPEQPQKKTPLKEKSIQVIIPEIEADPIAPTKKTPEKNQKIPEKPEEVAKEIPVKIDEEKNPFIANPKNENVLEKDKVPQKQNISDQPPANNQKIPEKPEEVAKEIPVKVGEEKNPLKQVNDQKAKDEGHFSFLKKEVLKTVEIEKNLFIANPKNENVLEKDKVPQKQNISDQPPANNQKISEKTEEVEKEIPVKINEEKNPLKQVNDQKAKDDGHFSFLKKEVLKTVEIEKNLFIANPKNENVLEKDKVPQKQNISDQPPANNQKIPEKPEEVAKKILVKINEEKNLLISIDAQKDENQDVEDLKKKIKNLTFLGDSLKLKNKEPMVLTKEEVNLEISKIIPEIIPDKNIHKEQNQIEGKNPKLMNQPNPDNSLTQEEMFGYANQFNQILSGNQKPKKRKNPKLENVGISIKSGVISGGPNLKVATEKDGTIRITQNTQGNVGNNSVKITPLSANQFPIEPVIKKTIEPIQEVNEIQDVQDDGIRVLIAKVNWSSNGITSMKQMSKKIILNNTINKQGCIFWVTINGQKKTYQMQESGEYEAFKNGNELEFVRIGDFKPIDRKGILKWWGSGWGSVLTFGRFFE